MRKFRINRKTRNILLGILGIGLIIGAAALIGNLVNKSKEETKEIHPTFEVGGLTEDGKYLENKESIYTKKAFECKGLNVKLDFDADVTYQIYFYDELDEFVSKTEVLSVGYNDEIPTNAELARIVVTPTYADDVEDEDREIKFYEILKYSKQLTITVAKEQASETLKLTIDNLTIEYEEGMTWREWVNSSYNTFNAVIESDGSDYISFGDLAVATDDNDMPNVEPSDLIDSSLEYHLV